MNELSLNIQQNSGCIELNFEEIEERLDKKLAEYKGAVFTEETKDIAKAELASLRKFKKEFEDAFYQRDKQNSQKALDGMKELFGEDNTEVKRAEAKMRMRKNWN